MMLKLMWIKEEKSQKMKTDLVNLRKRKTFLVEQNQVKVKRILIIIV